MIKFEDFYTAYPRKKSREDARKAWGQALAKGFSPDEIMAGLRINLPSMRAKDPQFVPYPATWLRAGGWADEPDVGFKPVQRRTAFQQRHQAAIDAFDRKLGLKQDDEFASNHIDLKPADRRPFGETGPRH